MRSPAPITQRRVLHSLCQGFIFVSLYFPFLYLEVYLNAQFEAGNAKERKNVQDISAFWLFFGGFYSAGSGLGRRNGLRLRLRLQLLSIPWGMLVKRSTLRPKRNFIGFYGNDATQHCAYFAQLRRRKPCPTSFPVQPHLPRSHLAPRRVDVAHLRRPGVVLLLFPLSICCPSPKAFTFRARQVACRGCNWSVPVGVKCPHRHAFNISREGCSHRFCFSFSLKSSLHLPPLSPASPASRHWHWYSGLGRNCSRSWSWCWCWGR